MSSATRLFFRAIFLLLASFLLLAGCKTLRLPSFDPQGRGLFAPLGTTTEVLNPLEDGFSELGVPSWPTPAFQSPRDPAACRPARFPSQLSDLDTRSAGAPGEVRVLPAVVAAPVGMEVILRGVIYDSEGGYAHGQSLHWSLPDDDIGRFVDVGGGNPQVLERIIPTGSRQLESHAASSFSSARREVVTRGTSDSGDDIPVERGQTWLAITSDQTGTSHVTLTAPDVDSWTGSPAEAQVYWLDMDWLFPSQHLAAAGRPAQLETHIRNTQNEPLPGWAIRYTLPGDGSTHFAARNQQTLEVTTNADGIAAVSIEPATDHGQQIELLVEILVPSELVDGRQMILARKVVPIRWTGNSVHVSIESPQHVAVGQAFPLRTTIHNDSNADEEDVIIESMVPAGMQILRHPDAIPHANGPRWSLGTLAAGDTREIVMQAVLDSEGARQLQMSARSRQQVSRSVRTIRGIHFPLDVQIVSPARAIRNQVVPITLQITNKTERPLKNITFEELLDSGLLHVDTEQGEDREARQLAFTLDDLQANETVEKRLDLRAVKIGQLCHTLRVTLADGLSSSYRSCLEVADAQASDPLQMDFLGPRSLRVGQAASYQLRISNQSSAALQEAKLSCQLPAGLTLQSSSPGSTLEGDKLNLSLESIEVGQTRELEFQLRANEVAATTSLEGCFWVEGSESLKTSLPLTVLARTDDSTSTAAAGRTGWTLLIKHIGDPPQVGQPLEYEIHLRNDRDFSDKNVQLQVELPSGLELVSFLQPHAGEPELDDQRRTIVATPIREVLPREALRPYQLTVLPHQLGQIKIRVSVVSARSTSPSWIQSELLVTSKE